MEICELSDLPLRHDFEVSPYRILNESIGLDFKAKMFSLTTDRDRVLNCYWIDRDTAYWYLVREVSGSYRRIKASTLKNEVQLFD